MKRLIALTLIATLPAQKTGTAAFEYIAADQGI